MTPQSSVAATGGSGSDFNLGQLKGMGEMSGDPFPPTIFEELDLSSLMNGFEWTGNVGDWLEF
jgi:hypothetical protein